MKMMISLVDRLKRIHVLKVFLIEGRTNMFC